MTHRRRTRGRNHLRDDTGSVLVLGAGLVAVCLLALVVVFDAAAAFTQRQQLLAIADAAAVAGAQSIDLDAYYANGATQGTRLSPVRVVASAQARVREAAATVPGVTLDDLRTDGVVVRVTVSRPLDLPFGLAPVGARASVESAARLDYRPR